MIQNDNYFRFDMYGDNWSELIALSKYVFQNKDNKVGNFNSLPFLVFHFIVNHNLSDLELFFRLAGFSAFTIEEMPDSITIPDVINLTNRDYVYDEWLGLVYNKEKAKAFIEKELGVGVISKYYDVKKQLLYHQEVKIFERELKNKKIN